MSWGAVLFAFLGLIPLGLFGLCEYEAWALQTKQTTISAMVAGAFQSNPHLYVVVVFTAGVILGALITHFTNWTSV